MKELIEKYLKRIMIDYPAENKIYLDFVHFADEIVTCKTERNKRFTIAIPPKECHSWLTPEKEYPILSWSDDGFKFYIIDDEGDELICVPYNDGHIKRNDWILK